MVPLKAVKVDLDIVPGRGPVIGRPIRRAGDLAQLQPLDPADLDYVSEAVGLLVAELGETPLIGFAGAPFTLASYLVEGGPSKDYAATKSLMVSEPALWDALCTRLADLSATFLQVQIAAGASVVQLFDSWAGSLSAADYARYAEPYSARTLAAVAATGVPRIHFGVGTSELLGLMGEAGAEVVGVDWRVPLAEASRRIGPAYAVQGNLDPALLSAPWSVLSDRVREVIRSGAHAPGHIFNLGHGVPPDTDPGVLARIVDLVHSEAGELRQGVCAA
jgi:uroporphyrinogen decarboxylase